MKEDEVVTLPSNTKSDTADLKEAQQEHYDFDDCALLTAQNFKCTADTNVSSVYSKKIQVLQ
eukprot:10821937-Ditylum_brightwellii.AAC.1